MLTCTVEHPWNSVAIQYKSIEATPAVAASPQAAATALTWRYCPCLRGALVDDGAPLWTTDASVGIFYSCLEGGRGAEISGVE